MKNKREAVFQPEFREDLRFWIQNDRKVALRCFEIVEAITRDPFTGIGKPEPLKTSRQVPGHVVSPKNIASSIWLKMIAATSYRPVTTTEGARTRSRQ